MIARIPAPPRERNDRDRLPRLYGVRGLRLGVGTGAPGTLEQSTLSCATAAATSRKARNEGLRVPFV